MLRLKIVVFKYRKGVGDEKGRTCGESSNGTGIN